MIDRRLFIGGTAAALATAASAATDTPKFGLIGKLSALPGKRDALAAIIAGGTGGMPGCLSYVVAHDVADPNGIWITEVWESEAAHAASLKLPAVRAAIGEGIKLMDRAAAGVRHRTVPVGGMVR